MIGFQGNGISLGQLSLYDALTTARRIPTFASLKRSISEFDLRYRRQSTDLVVHGSIESEEVQKSTEVAQSPQPLPLGTERKYAVQGTHMLNAALTESENEDPRSQIFSRQLYVNSLTYLLQGLPPDLDEQETSTLQRALPDSLAGLQRCDAASSRSSAPSALHRSISAVVVSFCVFIRLALPYLRYLLTLAHSYERAHHVTENALGASITAVDSISQKSTDMAGAAVDSPLIMSAATYCLEGICGGLNEGLGEGIKAIKARSAP